VEGNDLAALPDRQPVRYGGCWIVEAEVGETARDRQAGPLGRTRIQQDTPPEVIGARHRGHHQGALVILLVAHPPDRIAWDARPHDDSPGEGLE
jgi:hypothetical protein